MSSLDEIIRLCLVNHQALMVTLGGLAPMLLLGFAFGVYERLRELQGRNIGNGVFLAYYINICLVGVVGMCYTYEWVPDDLWSVLALMVVLAFPTAMGVVAGIWTPNLYRFVQWCWTRFVIARKH